MSNIQLAANLLRLRTDHDYTQTQIGAKLNISRQAYSNYETGKRIPDLDILIRIADLYHVTLEQLILQPCTGAGVVNENTGPYYIGMEVESADTIYLSKEEVELLYPYPEDLRPHEMPQLVYENEDGQCEQDLQSLN